MYAASQTHTVKRKHTTQRDVTFAEEYAHVFAAARSLLSAARGCSLLLEASCGEGVRYHRCAQGLSSRGVNGP